MCASVLSLKGGMRCHSACCVYQVCPWLRGIIRITPFILDRIREKAMATHSSTLAWKIPWTEEPGRLQSMGSLGVGHDWRDLAAAEADWGENTSSSHISLLEAHSLHWCSHMQSRYHLPNLIDKEKDLRAEWLFEGHGHRWQATDMGLKLKF